MSDNPTIDEYEDTQFATTREATRHYLNGHFTSFAKSILKCYSFTHSFETTEERSDFSSYYDDLMEELKDTMVTLSNDAAFSNEIPYQSLMNDLDEEITNVEPVTTEFTLANAIQTMEELQRAFGCAYQALSVLFPSEEENNRSNMFELLEDYVNDFDVDLDQLILRGHLQNDLIENTNDDFAAVNEAIAKLNRLGFDDIKDMFQLTDSPESERYASRLKSGYLYILIRCKRTLRAYFQCLRSFLSFLQLNPNFAGFDIARDFTVPNMTSYLDSFCLNGETTTWEMLSNPPPNSMIDYSADPQQRVGASNFSRPKLGHCLSAFSMLYYFCFRKPLTDIDDYGDLKVAVIYHKRLIHERGFLTASRNLNRDVPSSFLTPGQYRTVLDVLHQKMSSENFPEGNWQDNGTDIYTGGPVSTTSDVNDQLPFLNQSEYEINRYGISKLSPMTALAEFTLGVSCMLRFDTKAAIRLNHLDVSDFDTSAEENYKCLRFQRVKEKVRNETSTFQTSTIFRHKNPEQCPILAIAILLYVKYGKTNDIASIEASGASNEAHPNPTIQRERPQGREKWMLNSLFDYGYVSSYKQINSALKESAIPCKGGTHTLRKTGAEIAHDRGVPDSEIKAAGRWGTEKDQAQYTYHGLCSKTYLQVMAGFSVNESYNIPRAKKEIPRELVKLIFPWVFSYPWTGNTGLRMKNLLIYLAEVLVQDLPFLFQKYPVHFLRSDAVFRTEVMINHFAASLEQTDSLGDIRVQVTQGGDLQRILENLLDRLSNFASKDDLQYMIDRKTQTRGFKQEIESFCLFLSRDLQTTLLKQEKIFIERVKNIFSEFKTIADDLPNAGDSIHSAMIRCVEMLQESGEYIGTPNPKNRKRRRTAYFDDTLPVDGTDLEGVESDNGTAEDFGIGEVETGTDFEGVEGDYLHSDDDRADDAETGEVETGTDIEGVEAGDADQHNTTRQGISYPFDTKIGFK